MNRVKDIILSHFEEHDKDKISEWLYSLEKCCIDSNRLIICLAIDLENKLVEQDKLKTIILDCSTKFHNFKTPLIAFFEAIKLINKTEYLLCCENLSSNKTGYVRIINWFRYRNEILPSIYEPRATETYNTFIENNYKEYKRALSIAKISGKEVVIKGGRNDENVVWVAPSNEVDEILLKNNSSNIATMLCDIYGLYHDVSKYGVSYYILLFYPQNQYIEAKQPSSICADWDWKDGLYLSFKKQDSFGRTVSISGANASGRERVHKKIKLKFAELDHKFINSASQINKNTKEILNEGFKRLNLL